MRSTEEREARSWIVPVVVILVVAVLASVILVCITLLLQRPQEETSKAVATQIMGPANQARNGEVQAAVQQGQIAITQAFLANPNLADAGQVTLQRPYPDVTLTASGPSDNWTLTGRSTRTGYTYTYTSRTGQYAGTAN